MDIQELIFYALIGVLARIITWNEKVWVSLAVTVVAACLVLTGTRAL